MVTIITLYNPFLDLVGGWWMYVWLWNRVYYFDRFRQGMPMLIQLEVHDIHDSLWLIVAMTMIDYDWLMFTHWFEMCIEAYRGNWGAKCCTLPGCTSQPLAKRAESPECTLRLSSSLQPRNCSLNEFRSYTDTCNYIFQDFLGMKT